MGKVGVYQEHAVSSPSPFLYLLFSTIFLPDLFQVKKVRRNGCNLWANVYTLINRGISTHFHAYG